MKRILLSSLMLLSVVALIGQQTKGQLTREDYLKKSKRQNTTAWIMLGGGAAAAIGGSIWWGQEFTLFGPTSSGESAAGLLVVAGGLSMIGSVPVFIASGRNKRKANELMVGLKMEDAVFCQGARIKYQHFPAVSFTLPIK